MQAPIPKATLLQGLRPNLNEGDHCVFPPGFRVGKILPKGGSPFKQGEILQGGTQISYFTTPWVGNANSVPQLFFLNII